MVPEQNYEETDRLEMLLLRQDVLSDFLLDTLGHLEGRLQNQFQMVGDSKCRSPLPTIKFQMSRPIEPTPQFNTPDG